MKNLNLTYAEIVSSIALLTSFSALAWNIVRDLIKDKNSLSFRIVFGQLGNIGESTTGLFIDAGDIPNHKFSRPQILTSIVNTGRRNVVVHSVGGEYKNEYEDNKFFTLAIVGLPKMIEPYEVFNHIADMSEVFLEQIIKNNIKSIWVEDTKGKKWLLGKGSTKRLKETAQYIKDGKHLVS